MLDFNAAALLDYPMAESLSYKKIEFPHDGSSAAGSHPGIFSRIIEHDETAMNDCLTAYGSLIWALAKKFTDSAQDAENATQEVFLELWSKINRFDSEKASERDFVFAVAYLFLKDRIYLNRSITEKKATVFLPLPI